MKHIYVGLQSDIFALFWKAYSEVLLSVTCSLTPLEEEWTVIMGGKQRSTQELPADLHVAHIYSNLGILEEKRPFRLPEDIFGGFLTSLV